MGRSPVLKGSRCFSFIPVWSPQNIKVWKENHRKERQGDALVTVSLLILELDHQVNFLPDVCKTSGQKYKR